MGHWFIFYFEKQKSQKLRLTIMKDAEGHERAYNIPKRQNIYLGKDVISERQKGFDTLSEVRAIIDEMIYDALTLYMKNSYDSISDSYSISRHFSINEYFSIELESNEEYVLNWKDFQKRLRFLKFLIKKGKGNPKMKQAAIQIVDQTLKKFKDLEKR